MLAASGQRGGGGVAGGGMTTTVAPPAAEVSDNATCAAALAAADPPPGVYCAGTWDSWLCWPHTAANTSAYLNCPDIQKYKFDPARLAHKECLADGSWFRHPANGKIWSNYTTCTSSADDMSGINAVYQAGYTVSLLALLLSLAILFHFKTLRCARITVHTHLFASFALNNALWLAWYPLVAHAPGVVAASPGWCRALAAGKHYSMLSTYTWMLCEGVYLHTVLVSAFVAERRLLRALYALGWALPLPVSAAAVARMAWAAGDECWVRLDDEPPPEAMALVAGAVLLNVGFLCNIVRVLCTKLRGGGGARPAPPSAAALHALRATCLLAPLLGLQYLLTPCRPAPSAPHYRLYLHVMALSASLQGLCVAVLYCFLNGEVLALARRRWRALTFRPRANSTTNTTVSFVRSAATQGGGGGGEDKV